MAKTKIEWTERTWNPLRGCSKVSPGCKNCYAERMAARFSKSGEPFFNVIDGGKWNGRVELVESKLYEPFRWRKPCRVFVNSMSDLFHEAVPVEWIDRIFDVMARCRQHTFQVLTKRSERMYETCRGFAPMPHVWLGVSVEDQKSADERIPHLLATPAAVRFVSVEPLLEKVDLRRYLNAKAELADRDGLSSRYRKGVGCSRGWNDLEDRHKTKEQVDWHKRTTSTCAAQGREERGAIPSGPRHVEGGALFDGRAQAGVAVLHGSDSGRAYGQPQERSEDRQQNRKPGIGDKLGAGDPREQGPENRLWSEPAGRAQPSLQVVMGECGGDKNHAEFRESAFTVSGAVPSESADDFKDLQIRALDLVIVGGESGPGARPCQLEWIRSIVRQCAEARVPCFVKQLGTAWVRDGWRMSHTTGETWAGKKGNNPDHWPPDLNVRQYPEAPRG